MKLDPWQQQVMETPGNICLRSGRQVGKSTVISQKAAEYAINNPKKKVMIIASVERQAYLMLEKVVAYLSDNHKNILKSGKHRPTKSKVQLKNGSIIYSLPTGMTGYGIRGFTIDLLIADEAAFIPEEVWIAVTPMLAVTRGKRILLSTPHGKGGYYYSCFKDDNFTTFHISSEDCPRKDVQFLERERARMTKVQYAQEYLGEFIDDLIQFFPTDLIKKCMTLSRKESVSSLSSENFLGVDVARMGGDESVLLSVHRKNNRLKQFDMIITTDTLLTETVREILNADAKYQYKKIYIDDGGMGVGVFDPLLENEQTKRKVEAINNARRSIDNEDKRKKLLKEDLYNNLLNLMETGKIELFNEPEIFMSLKSIQYEYLDAGKLRIFGRYTHITEALIRAAWCMKNKSLNIWIA